MAEKYPTRIKVILKKYGPVIIDGPVEVSFSDGEIKEAKRIVLCRCNESKKMPFCDGRHKQIAYSSN